MQWVKDQSETVANLTSSYQSDYEEEWPSFLERSPPWCIIVSPLLQTIWKKCHQRTLAENESFYLMAVVTVDITYWFATKQVKTAWSADLLS